MPVKPMNESRTALTTDLLLVTFLVAFDVAARLLLHTWNFTPVAASALFAGRMLHFRGLALLVPLAAMFVSDMILGFFDWRITAVVYVSLALSAVIGMLSKRYTVWRMLVPAAVLGSLIFFATTNLAVWAFSGMYTLDMAGLIKCYIAALPFLQYTVAGDLFWSAALFGGAGLVQLVSARLRRRSNAAQPRLTPTATRSS